MYTGSISSPAHGLSRFPRKPGALILLWWSASRWRSFYKEIAQKFRLLWKTKIIKKNIIVVNRNKIPSASTSFLLYSESLWWEVSHVSTRTAHFVHIEWAFLQPLHIFWGSTNVSKHVQYCVQNFEWAVSNLLAELIRWSWNGEGNIPGAESPSWLPWVEEKGLERRTEMVFSKASTVVLFCLSAKPLACGWYVPVILWVTPAIEAKTLDTWFTNSLPWSEMWREWDPYLQMSWV